MDSGTPRQRKQLSVRKCGRSVIRHDGWSQTKKDKTLLQNQNIHQKEETKMHIKNDRPCRNTSEDEIVLFKYKTKPEIKIAFDNFIPMLKIQPCSKRNRVATITAKRT